MKNLPSNYENLDNGYVLSLIQNWYDILEARNNMNDCGGFLETV